MGDGNDELLDLFLAESREHLADIEADLLAIESSGANIDEELVNKVFRAAHSIEGGAGFLEMTQLGGLRTRPRTSSISFAPRSCPPHPKS